MKWTEENIVFLISMPRSGSTLLQRILLSQSQIASTSESWLFLPQIYALKENTTFSEYSHTAASRAINDFCDCLPGEKKEYLSIIKEAAIESYHRVSSNGKKIYLEKTPRNNLVLMELVSMFPKSKYIFLWRNPVSIVASMIESFASGKWNIYRQEIDLYKGFDNMLNADVLNIKNRIDIRYEDLVSMPYEKAQELLSFLEIDADGNINEFVSSKLNGRMGDPTGVKEYSTISTKSIEKWKRTFSNPLRKYWLTRYVEDMEEEKLSKIGYDKKSILESIDSIKVQYKNIFSDSMRMAYGVLDRNLQISLIRRLHHAFKGKRKYTLQ